MGTILDYYKYAALATSAYVRMGGNPLDGATFAAQASNPNQAEGRLPLSIAQYLFDPPEGSSVSPWTVAHYFGGDMPESDDNSGFAATLLRKGGENVLAIRGVEPTFDIDGVRDLVAAGIGGIGLLGVALNQVVDMVNLIQRLYGSGMVTQIRAEISLTRPEGPTANFLELESNVPGVPLYLRVHTFEVQGHGVLEAGEKITVTGHSLGGHLAIVAAQLFGDRISPDVYVFNSAGFDPASVNLVSAATAMAPLLGNATLGLINSAKAALVESLGVDALLLSNGSQQVSAVIIGMICSFLGSQPRALTVYNLESEDSAPGNDASVVASIFTGAGKLGEARAVGTEANSHSIEQMMDALALQAVLSRLDPSMDLTVLKQLVDAAAPRAAESEEILTEAIHSLLTSDSRFAAPGIQLPISDATEGFVWTGKGNIDARDAFHRAILEVNGRLDELGPRIRAVASLVGLPDVTIASIAASAQDDNADQAFRYALVALNPFAVFGVDYSPHNTAGELDPYDPNNRLGTLTDRWIKDRAAFLAAKNEAYTLDLSFAHGDLGAENWRYQDWSLGHTVDLRGLTSDPEVPFSTALPRLGLFGGSSADALTGASQADRLYGGAGTDVLEGKGGDDYLEGGLGLDIYQYRSGKAVISSFNEGHDTILDIDGKGVLRHLFESGPFYSSISSTVIVDASIQVSGSEWRSVDGRFVYTLIPAGEGRSDLRITFNNDAGGSITLRDFRDGDFYIRLGEHRVAPIFDDPVNTLTGDEEGNLLTGTSGPDSIEGLGGVDIIYAGGGDDLVDGGDATDYIYGEGGNDRLSGGAGGDQLYGGAGRDHLDGGPGQDILEGGDDDDRLAGGDDSDILVGGDGRDEIFAREGMELAAAFQMSEESHSLAQRGDWLDGGEGDDVLIGFNQEDVLLGGGGADILLGGAGNDVIRGDSGRELVSIDWSVVREIIESDLGTHYQTRFVNATIVLSPNAGDDRIYGGAGNDWAFGEGGDDLIDGGSGNDVLFGDAGDDIIIGGFGNDVLIGDNPTVVLPADEGSDYLDGGAGSDTIYGNGGDDVLIGGTGNDFLYGGTGKDIYIFNRGDGTDVVFDLPEDSKAADASIVVIGSTFQSQVKFRPGSLLIDLGLADADDPESPHDRIYFEGFDTLNPWATPVIDYIQFDDGLVMTFEDILAQGFDIEGTEFDDNGIANSVLTGTAVTDRIRGLGGSDELQGYGGDDFLDGGAGNDRIFGGGGDDHLIGGEGADQLVGDAGNDRLKGGDGRDALWGGAGDDYLAGGADFDRLFGGAGIDTYLFDEQDTVFDLEGNSFIALGDDLQAEDVDLRRLIVNGQVVFQLKKSVEAGGVLFAEGMGISVGTDSRLAGYVLADGTIVAREQMLRASLVDGQFLAGTESDDLLEGYAGDDWLRGGEGNDTLRGYRGKDRLEGGAGDDLLEGGAGDDLLFGDAGNDTLDGGAGNDRLSGGAGDDIYLFGPGSGRDTIADEGDPGDTDSVLMAAGIARADVALSRRANGDLALAILGGADELVVDGYYVRPGNRIERIVFADGTEIGAVELDALEVPPIVGTPGDDSLVGTPYDDTLLGGAGNDTLDGGTGNDVLVGGAGVDSYVLAPGGGLDRVVDGGGEASVVSLANGLRFTDLQAVRDGDDLRLLIRGSADGLIILDYFADTSGWQVVNSGGEQITLPALIEQLVFTGGVGSVAEAEHRYLDSVRLRYLAHIARHGHSGSLRIESSYSDEPVVGRGSRVNETVEGEFRYLNVARIQAGPSPNFLNLYYSGVIAADAGDGDDFIYAYGWGYDEIGDFLSGGAGDDRIVGTFVDDVILGGPGSDYLAGTDGNDTYVFLWGDVGFDIVDEVIPEIVLNGGYYSFGGGRDNVDTVEFGDGITYDGLVVTYGLFDAASIGDGNYAFTYDTLDISWAPGRGVRVLLPNTDDPWVAGALASFPGESFGIERFVFPDGSVRTIEDILDLLAERRTIIGTEFADVIYGDARDNLIYGLGGDDLLGGGPGDDVLDGGPGDDELFDYSGSDTYLFGRGYGHDYISESGIGFDTLRFLEGVDPSDVTVMTGNRQTVSLILAIDGTPDRAEISYWFSEEPWNPTTIEQIAFADGTIWDRDAVFSRLQASAATGDNDLVVGTLQSDELDGLDGNDAVLGFEGDDVLRGGLGNDYIAGALGSDILLGEEGDDYLEEWSGNNLLHGGTGDDYLYTQGPANMLIGGAGDDWIDSYAGNNVVAYNAGDGSDLLYVKASLTLSLGGGISLQAATLTREGAEWILGFGTGDSIRLSRSYEPDPEVWPAMRLQVIGDDIRTYDLGSLISELQQSGPIDPGTVIALGNALQDYLTDVSVTHAYGGALAYGYATTGTAFSSQATALPVLTDPAFGAEAQFVPGVPVPPVIGSSTSDVLLGTAGAELLEGGTGDDWLDAGGGDDTLIGGPGADLLMGGAGADTYIYEIGDGIDTIWDPSSPSESNTLVLGEGIDPQSISLGLGSLVLNFGEAGGAIHLVSFDPRDPFNARDIDRFVFADGSTLSYEELLARGFDILGTEAADLLTGTALVDRINGGAGNDTLEGLGGDDVLTGAEGRDVYRFDRHFGQVLIVEAGLIGEVDAVVFAGSIAPGEVSVRSSGVDLILELAGTDGRIVLAQWLDPVERVEEVRFADGTVWSEVYLASLFSSMPEYTGALLNQAAIEDAVFSYTLAEDVFTSNGTQPLSFSATLADGSALPQWLGFDAATLSFNGTPLNADVGTVSITVTASDAGGNAASGSFILAVINTNDPPRTNFALDALHTPEDQPFTLVLPTGLFSDDDIGDVLSLSVTREGGAALPGWLSFDVATGNLSGVPGNPDVGSYLLDVTATDLSGAQAQASLSLTVDNVNDPPIAVSALSDVSVAEGRTVLIALPQPLFVDVDAGDSLSYSAHLSGGAALPAWLAFDAGQLRFVAMPGPDDQGDYIVEIEARDLAGATASTPMRIEVINVNTVFGSNAPDTLELGRDFDIVHAGNGDDLVRAGSGDDVVFGDNGNDRLEGEAGNDWLSGGRGNDTLAGGGGRDALVGDEGNDTLIGSTARSFVAGGKGDDVLHSAGEATVVALNAQEGNDHLIGLDRKVTVSLGAGLGQAPLSLRRTGADLTLDTGRNSTLTFADWYGDGARSEFTLQSIVASSADPASQVRRFDFDAWVAEFDAAQASGGPFDPTANLQAHEEAVTPGTVVGGEIAWHYAANGTLAGMDAQALQAVLAEPGFAAQPQAIPAGELAAYRSTDAQTAALLSSSAAPAKPIVTPRATPNTANDESTDADGSDDTGSARNRAAHSALSEWYAEAGPARLRVDLSLPEFTGSDEADARRSADDAWLLERQWRETHRRLQAAASPGEDGVAPGFAAASLRLDLPQDTPGLGRVDTQSAARAGLQTFRGLSDGFSILG